MEEVTSVPRRTSSTLASKKLDGWRANSNLEASDGGISDEYSDDDDPGYRIVLVEDVGELYPDVSYRQRNRLPDPVQGTPSASNTGRSRNKDARDISGNEGDEDGDQDEDGSDEDEREESSSDVEDDLVQRLKSLNSPDDPDTLTRLPVRISPAAHQDGDANQDSPPASADDGPVEPILAWGGSDSTSLEKASPSAAASAAHAASPDKKSDEKKAKDSSKPRADDSKKERRGGEEARAAKDGAHKAAEGADKGGAAEGEGEGEAGADADELAAHHMPDLIEAHPPMFAPSSAAAAPPAAAAAAAAAPPASPSAAAAAAASGKHKPNGAAEGAAAAQPSAAAGEEEAKAAVAVPAPPPAGVAASAKDDAAAVAAGGAEKAGPEPSDETVYYDCFDLKIVYERNRTGFEETKDFPIEINGVIAGRYQILEFLGAAAFSKAVQCVDLTDGSYVCIKIIKNNKDFLDQSLDEIKILKYLNAHDTRDDHHLLQLYDYFYFKEHLFIVTELLRDNLYEFSKFNRESGAENYFTLPRLQKITRECLEGLKFVHELRLIHCDLKPENILIRSYSRCEIKIIDFGSSCFVTDHLTSYVQSRSYRAPEVILGLPYDELIDMWSLGCILAELWTGRVLFQNDSLATLLARVVGILGGIDEDMLLKGRYTHRFFTKHKILYDRLSDEERSLVYIFPKRTTLEHRLASSDALFVEFISKLLEVNPARRLSAAKALQHPWLAVKYP